MRRAHAMPFGAEVRGAQGVCFRLWAPSARHVALCLEPPGGTAAPRPMQCRDGVHELLVPEARPGTRYRFEIDGGLRVPDPASRFQPEGVHGPSEVIDPRAFAWPDAGWRGRPWREAVIYELHVGTFSAAGDFAAVHAHLDRLAALGVTAIELMPVADFPGARGWGYDGVALFAPCRAYGRPEALKALVAAAHARGLMVLLDVVYNHFGPEGNYLHAYAPEFFTRRHATPWGEAIDLDGPHSARVREFFVHNALYWLEEYGFDGLRLDAVHEIYDASDQHLLEAVARAVAAGPGATREVHLVLENDANEASRLSGSVPAVSAYRAQWNDDLHHALHVLLTAERDGYYADYADAPLAHLGRCLAEGFAWQGEPSAHRDGAARGEPSAALPPTAFIGFLQNHDQVGNRALGERLAALAPCAALRAATSVLALAPQVPMLFMGEEIASRTPFLFFCDFGPELAAAVTRGRRREFARFARFSDPSARATIPDPGDPQTFERSRVDWSALDAAPGEQGRAHLALLRELLALRHRHVAPHLDGARADGRHAISPGGVLGVAWRLGDGSRLTLHARLAAAPAMLEGVRLPSAPPLHALPHDAPAAAAGGTLPPWSVLWHLQPAAGGER